MLQKPNLNNLKEKSCENVYEYILNYNALTFVWEKCYNRLIRFSVKIREMKCQKSAKLCNAQFGQSWLKFALSSE